MGPSGGGLKGGFGGGAFVRRDAGEFVRSGDGAARLTVRSEGKDPEMAWSAVSQRVFCLPGVRVRAGIWLYYSATRDVLATSGTVAQLRLEYFSDDAGEHMLATHVVLSPPRGAAGGDPADQWLRLSVDDRVPAGARCLRMSLVLMSERPSSAPQSVWADDAFLVLESPRSGGRERAVTRR